MAQHFLLSKAAKTLSLASVLTMKDADAEMTFRRVRWADTNGEPVCSHCGGVDAYDCRRLNRTLSARCLSQRFCGRQPNGAYPPHGPGLGLKRVQCEQAGRSDDANSYRRSARTLNKTATATMSSKSPLLRTTLLKIVRAPVGR